jgi:hypothetical protein
MNDARRKQIEEVLGRISEARADLETLKDEEQDYYDNMPESFQNGQNGEKAQAAIDALDEAINKLEDVESDIETAKE